MSKQNIAKLGDMKRKRKTLNLKKKKKYIFLWLFLDREIKKKEIKKREERLYSFEYFYILWIKWESERKKNNN